MAFLNFNLPCLPPVSTAHIMQNKETSYSGEIITPSQFYIIPLDAPPIRDGRMSV